MPSFLLVACLILEAAALAGLAWRRRWQHSYLLLPCVVSWLASDTTILLWPDCNTWRFWFLKESTHALLVFALGIELSGRLLVAAPLAQVAARRWLVSAVLLGAALFTVPISGALDVLPRLLAALAWLYLGLTLVLARYSMPLGRLHGAILLGLSPYCLLYWLSWSRVRDDTAVAGVINPAAFVIVLGALAWAIWSHEPEPQAEPALVELVWPWTR